MSQLTEEGYISRPHTSAGGIPSDLGYRYYVESLKQVPDLPEVLRRQIHRHFGQAAPDMEAWSQQCASILSRITANLAVVTVPRARLPRLKHIQLVYLQEFLVLLIIVLQEARLLRRVLALDEAVTQDLLDQAANKFNEYLTGLTHTEIEASQLELSPLEERVKRETSAMIRGAANRTSREHYVDGLRHLLGQPEFSDSSRTKEVVEMLEERVLLESLLSDLRESAGIAVYIGAENRGEALRSFAVIRCQYGIPQQASGTICVIGPTRMGYAEAISGVSYLSSLMSQLVREFHGINPSD